MIITTCLYVEWRSNRVHTVRGSRDADIMADWRKGWWRSACRGDPSVNWLSEGVDLESGWSGMGWIQFMDEGFRKGPGWKCRQHVACRGKNSTLLDELGTKKEMSLLIVTVSLIMTVMLVLLIRTIWSWKVQAVCRCFVKGSCMLRFFCKTVGKKLKVTALLFWKKGYHFIVWTHLL